jgi:osmotically-inducible protein OsmY/sporulation protein YlmC with PRC-barrel domain
MAKLDFDIGARVHCKDGDRGRLLKVVVDPYTQRITDLIVEKGFLLTTDRVLPVDMVERTSDGDVYLAISGDALEAYPEYREVEFKEPAPGVKAGVYDKGDVRCWQGAYRVVCTKPVIPMVRKQIYKGVDANLVVIERGMPVKNAQGTVGEVDHLLVDAESGEITHLVVRKGLIPYYPIIPISEVKGVSTGAVSVGLTEKEIDGFARYRSRSADDIKAELQDRLAGLGFNLTHMQIVAGGNIVQLTGWVPSVAAKRHAEAIARAVEGVIDVENLLDTDIAIRTRIVNALLSDPRTSVAVIEVINEQGIVTLRGEVDSAEIRAAAEEFAARQPGVLSVVNALEVKPDEYTERLMGRSFALGLWSEKIGGPTG